MEQGLSPTDAVNSRRIPTGRYFAVVTGSSHTVCPAARAWEEFGSLVDVLSNAPDPQDCRLRLRGVLRRIVGSIWLLVVARGRDRLAAVQVRFADNQHCRSYFILHRLARSNGMAHQDAVWWCRSLATRRW